MNSRANPKNEVRRVVSDYHLAYLAQGELHLQTGDAPTTIDSPFGRSLRDRALQIHHRHAWKSQGRGAHFMRGVLWPEQHADPGEFRIAMTAVSRGGKPGEFLYSLETDEISGIFSATCDGGEQRLFHTADFRVRNLHLHPEGASIALAISHNHHSANLAVLSAEGNDLSEVSEGDSIDLAPRWVPGPGRRLVFQSAGVGRDAAGRFSGFGPFAIQELDLDSGEIETLVEDPAFDLLGPQKTADGTLYYIRRPRVQDKAGIHPLHIVKDVALLPFRLAFAVFQFFNFFSMKYTGKPLATSQGAAQRQSDLKQMMIWGNLIDAARAVREDGLGDPEAPSLVPSSWQLIRQSGSAREVLAKSVLSFDFARDGSLIYSNGTAVMRLETPAARPERLLLGKMIEHVTAL